MITKEFTYVDYNGVTRKETHRFHFTLQEITSMELGVDGGFTNMLKKLSDKIAVPELERILKTLIDKSYGVMSDDGRKFVKREEYLEDFKSTEMYSQLYMELLQDSQAALAFIKGTFPVMTEEQKREFNAQLAEAMPNANITV